MLIKTTVMANCYMDSILILSVSREMMKLPGVKKAVVVMATDMNKTVVDEFGGMTPAVKSAGPNDLILSLDCESEDTIKLAEDKVKEIASGKSESAKGEAEVEYRKLTSAKEALPEANICIIYLPSEYALDEAKTALANDMNLFIFSDMPEEEEQRLAARGVLPDCELLVAGHHGSASSTGQALLDAVTPEMAVISVGYNNYGHPAQDTLDRLAAMNMEIYRTDQMGTVTVYAKEVS